LHLALGKKKHKKESNKEFHTLLRIVEAYTLHVPAHFARVTFPPFQRQLPVALALSHVPEKIPPGAHARQAYYLQTEHLQTEHLQTCQLT
jgi:hypothetical protein